MIKFGRFPFWDGQTLPFASFHHSSHVYYLTNMIGIMGQLPVDRVDDRMFLVSDIYFCAEIFSVQRVQSIEQTFPSIPPFFDKLLSGLNYRFKFLIPVPPFFFSI